MLLDIHCSLLPVPSKHLVFFNMALQQKYKLLCILLLLLTFFIPDVFFSEILQYDLSKELVTFLFLISKLVNFTNH